MSLLGTYSKFWNWPKLLVSLTICDDVSIEVDLKAASNWKMKSCSYRFQVHLPHGRNSSIILGFTTYTMLDDSNLQGIQLSQSGSIYMYSMSLSY